MIDLSPYIKDLIIQHECIILPEFGGFETHYMPACYNSDSKTLLPPSKKIVFKAEYQKGGEVIKQYISTKLNISEEKAGIELETYIEDLKTRLRNGEQILLKGLGIFKPTQTGIPDFESFNEENYLAESFGLEPLSVTEEPDFFLEKKHKLPKINIQYRNNSLSFVIVGILVISILLLITVLLSSKFELYFFNIGDKNQESDLIILGGNSTKGQATHVEQAIDNYTSVQNALLYLPEEQKEEPSAMHFLVVESLKNLSNAAKLKEKLIEDGYSADILESGGYYRVYLGSYSNKDDALVELQRIRKQLNHSIWLLSSNIEAK
ncbi:MAG: SPOR domain-containing protein [Bacteroidales bacterium]|nr:SPOR domain-containing protein [Bacteroidales bacterium]MBN2820618.1 SPOR domain-containing protein [Bacteroidales bacterium]